MEDLTDSQSAAPRLARRLRELRERAGVRLTQEELGRLLDEDGVSGVTVSMWENPSGGRLPPRHRLKAYALLFCTPRTFDGPPHRLPPDALTADERTVYRALTEELSALRDAAQSGGPPAMWCFPGGDPITIVCGRLPTERRPPQADPAALDYVRIARFADLDTLVDVYGMVKAANPASLVILTTASEMTRLDALNNLILIGKSELNLAGRWFARHLDLPVTVDEHGVHTGESEHGYRVEDGELIEDVGVFVRGPHPSAPNRTLIMCNGITTRGVRGAAQTFLDQSVRDRNARWVADRFAPDATFCVVLRVPVLNGEPLPQDLADPATRLYEWST